MRLADIALAPQIVNSERYRLDLSPYPTIARIYANCMRLDAFAAAHGLSADLPEPTSTTTLLLGAIILRRRGRPIELYKS